MSPRRPPGLAAKTVAVTFITVAVILSIVFIVLVVDARDRMRDAETDKLDISSRVFTGVRGAPRPRINSRRRQRWPRLPRSRPRSTPTTPRPDWERRATVGSRRAADGHARAREAGGGHIGERAGRFSTTRAACSPAPEAPGSSGR